METPLHKRFVEIKRNISLGLSFRDLLDNKKFIYLLKELKLENRSCMVPAVKIWGLYFLHYKHIWFDYFTVEEFG